MRYEVGSHNALCLVVVRSERDWRWHIWKHFVSRDLVEKNCVAKQDSRASPLELTCGRA